MLLYCKNCKQKVEVPKQVVPVSPTVICPRCGSSILFSTDLQDKTILRGSLPEDESEGPGSFKKLITRLFIVFMLLVAILVVLLVYPKTSSYTKTTLQDIYEKGASKITGKKYVKRAGEDLFFRGEELYHQYTYTSLKDANIFYQKAYHEDKTFGDARIGEAETYAMIGRLSNDTRLIRKALTVIKELEAEVNSSARLLRARADAESSQLRIDFSFNPTLDTNSIKAVYTQAVHDINQAMSLEPNNPYNYNIQGIVLFLNPTEDENSLNAFKKANELDRKFLDPLFNIALLFFVNNNNEKAIEYSNLTLQLNPELELPKSLTEVIQNEATLKSFSSKKKTHPKTSVEELPYSNDLAVEYITSFATFRKAIIERKVF